MADPTSDTQKDESQHINLYSRWFDTHTQYEVLTQDTEENRKKLDKDHQLLRQLAGDDWAETSKDSESNMIFQDSGDDTARIAGLNNGIYQGSGNDTLTLDAGADRSVLVGGEGYDTLILEGAPENYSFNYMVMPDGTEFIAITDERTGTYNIAKDYEAFEFRSADGVQRQTPEEIMAASNTPCTIALTDNQGRPLLNENGGPREMTIEKAAYDRLSPEEIRALQLSEAEHPFAGLVNPADMPTLETNEAEEVGAPTTAMAEAMQLNNALER